MELANLSMNRVILHEVFARPIDKTMLQPECSQQLENLNQEALDALCDRMVTAMAHKSKAVPMTITVNGEDSIIRSVKRLVDANNTDYIDESSKIALKLAGCQTTRKIPGGILVVIDGTYGSPARRVVFIIKAEIHNGFVRSQDAGVRTLQFLRDLMLTAQTKLYKVGLFIENDVTDDEISPQNGWSAYIYDELLSNSNKYDAALYFYGSFLGLKFPESSAKQTKKFHELTKSFIQKMNIEEEEKVTLHNALVTYLKADQSPTVGTAAFADTYLGDPAIQDAYSRYMSEAGFSEMPISKDISDLKNQLKLRKITFTSSIKIVGPAEEIKNRVTFEALDGDALDSGHLPKWTKIIVKDHITTQE